LRGDAAGMKFTIEAAHPLRYHRAHTLKKTWPGSGAARGGDPR
jgi:hypothetical protein